jgi:plastocyanin
MRRAIIAAAAALVALSGCSQGAGGQTPSARQTIHITVRGDKITPNGERVKVGTGQTVRFEVRSDHPGELHVHSTPEKELAFKKGTTRFSIRIDKPGIVDVEDHAADTVVLQLEVS